KVAGLAPSLGRHLTDLFLRCRCHVAGGLSCLCGDSAAHALPPPLRDTLSRAVIAEVVRHLVILPAAQAPRRAATMPSVWHAEPSFLTGMGGSPRRQDVDRAPSPDGDPEDVARRRASTPRPPAFARGNSAAGRGEAAVLGLSFLVHPDRDRIFRAHVPDNGLPGYSSATAPGTMARAVARPHSPSNR